MNNSTKFCFSSSGRGTNYEWRTVGGTCVAGKGVNTVFGYPGGAIMPVYDACMTAAWSTCCADMNRVRQWRYRLCPCYWQNWRMYRHVWSGATNLITGLADALLDSIPVVLSPVRYPHRLSALTHFRRWISGVVVSLHQAQFPGAITGRVPRIMAEAFDVASSGRPGPVWSIFQKISS